MTQLFTPGDIVPQDDAMHQKQRFSQIETWYFDALLNKGYSIVFLISVLTVGRWGLVQTGLHLYKDTHVVQSLRQRHPFKQLYGSEETLDISIGDHQVLQGSYDHEEQWVYHITMGSDDAGVDLQFVKRVPGWKGKTCLGSWLVIPHFRVTGTLKIEGKHHSVSGRGYHDHNMYPVYAPFVTRGYHFGNIIGDTAVITWARVLKSRSNEEIIVMVTREDEYVKIDPLQVSFTVEQELQDHGKRIPEVCSLNVAADQVHAAVRLAALNIHHIKMPTLNYWRYHLHCTGSVNIGAHEQQVDTVEIAEILKFF
jgi:hypothetical protein